MLFVICFTQRTERGCVESQEGRCLPWPVSWNSVSTSRKDMSEGAEPTGGALLLVR